MIHPSSSSTRVSFARGGPAIKPCCGAQNLTLYATARVKNSVINEYSLIQLLQYAGEGLNKIVLNTLVPGVD